MVVIWVARCDGGWHWLVLNYSKKGVGLVRRGKERGRNENELSSCLHALVCMFYNDKKCFNLYGLS